MELTRAFWSLFVISRIAVEWFFLFFLGFRQKDENPHP